MASTVPITFSVTVPALPDNDIWFANSADWSNYWLQASFSANIPVADTINYGVVKQAATNAYAHQAIPDTTAYLYQLDVNGTGVLTNFQVASADSVTALAVIIKNLQTDYENLRGALVNAGLIST